MFGRGQVWIELQRHLPARRTSGHPVAARSGGGVSRAGDGVQRRAVRDAGERPLYDVLTCIRHKTTLERAGRRLTANAERYLKPPETMARLFSDLPQALAGTEALAERLDFTLANLGYRFPDYPVPAGETQASFLRRLTQVGARDRYRPYHDRARAQIARELDLIEKLDLAGYFLIVWDIVNFCRQQRILVQGRGSAANSAVCYASASRRSIRSGWICCSSGFCRKSAASGPTSISICRAAIGASASSSTSTSATASCGAAMTANVITYRGRSAAREVGKVLGLDDDEIDRLAKMMNQFEFVDPDGDVRAASGEVGPRSRRSPRAAVRARSGSEMQDLPRHLGQHSGGMVICQGRLDDVVPLENASMPGRVVVQWDKDDCADLGIVKVDLLGLGMMAALETRLHS